MPIGSKGLGESGLKVVQSVEDRVGEDPAQRLEPAFRRVEFGAIGRQGDLRDALGPADLAAGVAARNVSMIMRQALVQFRLGGSGLF